MECSKWLREEATIATILAAALLIFLPQVSIGIVLCAWIIYFDHKLAQSGREASMKN
jgi:hypothetical protein